MIVTLFCFAANQMGYTDRREVKQFQYTAWPDHGVPEHPGPFLTFLRRITAVNPTDAGPVITHCRYRHDSRFCIFTVNVVD
jgi:netrin-G3 ligand